MLSKQRYNEQFSRSVILIISSFQVCALYQKEVIYHSTLCTFLDYINTNFVSQCFKVSLSVLNNTKKNLIFKSERNRRMLISLTNQFSKVTLLQITSSFTSKASKMLSLIDMQVKRYFFLQFRSYCSITDRIFYKSCYMKCISLDFPKKKIHFKVENSQSVQQKCTSRKKFHDIWHRFDN